MLYIYLRHNQKILIQLFTPDINRKVLDKAHRIF
jgi:hypothetical protein